MDTKSKPGDVVFSPFLGIGVEGYVAVQMGRKFIGTELKTSYKSNVIGSTPVFL
jgi:DNA modification methylase